MLIYHGSNRIIEKPEYGLGNIHNDYGLAFYCTENIELAKEWAVSENHDGFANAYNFCLEGMEVLHLGNGDYNILNWLAILLDNRVFSTGTDASMARNYIKNEFMPEYWKYDVIRGYRADDSYFAFANAFLNNAISIEKIYKVMKLGKLGEQIAIKSEKAFQYLVFEGADIALHREYYAKKKNRDDEARRRYREERALLTDDIYMIDIMRQQWRNNDERIQRIIY